MMFKCKSKTKFQKIFASYCQKKVRSRLRWRLVLGLGRGAMRRGPNGTNYRRTRGSHRRQALPIGRQARRKGVGKRGRGGGLRRPLAQMGTIPDGTRSLPFLGPSLHSGCHSLDASPAAGPRFDHKLSAGACGGCGAVHVRGRPPQARAVPRRGACRVDSAGNSGPSHEVGVRGSAAAAAAAAASTGQRLRTSPARPRVGGTFIRTLRSSP